MNNWATLINAEQSRWHYAARRMAQGGRIDAEIAIGTGLAFGEGGVSHSSRSPS